MNDYERIARAIRYIEDNLNEQPGLDEIAKEIPSLNPIEVIRQDRMEDAVLEASRIAAPGDVVLLAPGGTSFDAFTDFSQRGEVFRDLVNEIAASSN